MAQTTTAPPRQSFHPETDLFAVRPAFDRGRAVFTAAVGLIAVHVIDDSFLQPQPGTSAGDHLFSGLIPLAILAVAVWAYPRIRAGARAAMALSLVVPAVLSGSEAIYYAGKTGLSGDDYTGLLALVAAPVLLGLGVWTLWTSRRLGDGLARRYGRRLLKTAAVLVAAPLVLVPLSISYVGSHVSRAEVPEAELGAAYEDVTLETSDGLELEAVSDEHTACCSTTVEARATARVTPTASAGISTRTSAPASTSSRGGPMSTPDGSAVWACRWAGR